MKKYALLILFLFSFFLAPRVFAQNNDFVSVVNPVRGNDFWELDSQKPETSITGQIAILKKFNLPATWLIRFDALDDQEIISQIKQRSSDEKGLFLEVTPGWAVRSEVDYRESNSWHAAGSAFLTGYEREERLKLIDAAFEKFKVEFGIYPVSVGAWWIDSFSLDYMEKKYGITSALIVADQYSTDNYQIWGQYFGTPYYPSKNNALHPAQTLENKLDVVITQWALRDPVNSYGNGVMESTFSVQANDYKDYHNLNVDYFSALIDVYTNQQFNKFTHIVIGLENSYEWNKYSAEYQRQIEKIVEKKAANELAVVTLKDFADWYKSSFPRLSPEQLIITDDPLGSFKKTVWYMNPYYRVGWFYNQDGSVFRDIRQYIDGEEELCFKGRCDSVNFATSATRVLDEVSFGHKWVIDQGKITDFNIEKSGAEFIITYKNEAGNSREIKLLPRDISIDNKIYSIDGAILNAIKQEDVRVNTGAMGPDSLKWSFLSVITKIISFSAFLILAIIVPGLLLTDKTLKRDVSPVLRIFISSVVGFVILTLFFYISSLISFKSLVFIYLLTSLILFVRLKIYKSFVGLLKIKISSFLIFLLIIAGTIFQVIPTFRSGLNFIYGLGFWGPNTHDGLWHMALVNQLIRSVPPENPIYSLTTLKNYHYFYDLLVAVTNYLSAIPVVDLIFRFYPVLFSLMLGVGSYYLSMKLFKSKLAAFFGLYLIYFAGSFGWIVEFIREKHFGGESAFWANQAVSFNLNPPFASSLIIVIALLHILFNLNGFATKKNVFLASILAGSLIGFKSYGAILILASLLIVAIFRKQLSFLVTFVGATLISILIFLPNFNISSSVLIFSPFWFIHSMIDSPDRVGWVRVTLAREAGFSTGNWFKFIGAEALSLVIFIAGNLGLRIISLFSLVKIKSIIKDEKFLFVFILALLSFLIPILFIQSGNPWNTIQFSYYGLYVTALVSGTVIASFIVKLPKLPKVFLVLTVLILAPVNSVVTASGYLSNQPHAFVPFQESEGLQFLSKQPDGVVLTYPYDNRLKQKIPEPWPTLVYDSTAYVAALSKKAVYLEDEPQNQILLTEYKKRLVATKDFFLKPLFQSLEFLQDNNIKYVYLPKIYNVRLDESNGIVRKIFENEELIIYATDY